MTKRTMLLLAAAVMISLTSLTGCGDKALVRTEYVRPTIPALPAKPDHYSVKWKKVGNDYCLDETGAKNHLKNFELDNDHLQQHIEIIEGLR